MKQIDRPGSTTSKVFFFLNLFLVFIVLVYFLQGFLTGSDDFSIPDLNPLQYRTGNRQFSFQEPPGLFLREVINKETTYVYFYTSDADLNKDVDCFSAEQSYAEVSELENCDAAIAVMVINALPIDSYFTLDQQKEQEIFLYGSQQGEYSTYKDKLSRVWNLREEFDPCVTGDEKAVCVSELDFRDQETIYAVSFISRFHSQVHNTNLNHERFWKLLLDSLQFKM